MKAPVTIILALFFGLNTWAMNPNDSLIDMGNSLYNQKLYNDAISYYKKVIEHGFESAPLYYNMGNAYFRLNDMPPAILYYEKALKLDPDNEDIMANLNIANTRIPDKIEPVPVFFLIRWWNTFYNMFPVNDWTRIALAGFTMMMVFVVTFFTARKRSLKVASFWFGIVFLILSIFAFGLASQKYYYMNKRNEAIVFSPSVTVKSAPNLNGVDLFVIHEGTKVLISDRVDNWYKIKIANGSVGWLPAENARII